MWPASRSDDRGESEGRTVEMSLIILSPMLLHENFPFNLLVISSFNISLHSDYENTCRPPVLCVMTSADVTPWRDQ